MARLGRSFPARGRILYSRAVPSLITQRAALSGNATNTTITVTLPTYLITDFVVLVVASNNGNAQSFSGNVTATELANAGNRVVAYRIAPQDGAQTSFTLTVGVSSVFTWWIASYTGVDLAAAVYGANTATGNSTSATVLVPQVELPFLATGGELAFSAAGVNSTATWATSTSTVYSTSAGNAALQVRGQPATPGHLVTLLASMDRGNGGSARNQNAVAFALRPAQAVPLSLLTNGSFEAGASVATGWQTEGTIAGTPTWTVQSSTGVYDGAKAQQVTYAGLAGDSNTALAIYQAPITAAPGQIIDFAVYLSGTQTNCAGIVGIEAFTSGGVYISESDTAVSLTGTPARYAASYVCPAGTDHVACYVQFNEIVPTTALTAYIDQATLLLTAPGVSAATGAGVATGAAAGTITGTSTATGAGTASALATQRATGAATGAGTASAAAAQAGTATATGVGIAAANAVQSAAGTAIGAGVATGAAAGTVSGTSTATGAGVASALATQRASSSATGAGAATGAGQITGTSTAAGASTAQALARLVAGSTATGSGTATGAGGLVVFGTSTATGAGVATGTAASKITFRPDAGITPRPDTGRTTRPFAGVTTRP